MKTHLKSILILIMMLCLTAIILVTGCTVGHGDDNSTPHEHSYVEATIPPTCTEAGYIIHICTCGESYRDSFITANGHTSKAEARENEVKETCTTEGNYDLVVRCATCNEIITSTHKTTEKLAHSYKNDICTVCGDYDLSGITLENKTVIYDGTAQYISVNGTLPDGLTVVYDDNGKTNAGTYTVTATIKDSEKVYKTLTALLTIEKRELNVVFSGKLNLVYTGEEQKTVTVTAVNLVEGDTVDLSITYSGDMVEEGIYTVTATISGNNNYVLTKNNTVIVTILRATHTITFIQQGQPDIVVNVPEYASLEQSQIPTPVQITGYTVAWENKDLTNITKDIIVNAENTLIEYHITYVLNGGKNHIDNPVTYTIESPTFYLGSPTKSSSTFSGWYTTSNFLMDSRVLLIESGSHSDITLYAYWLEYKITSAIGFEIDMEQEVPLVSRDVAYTAENIDLNDKIHVSSGCSWNLYRDFEGFNELKLKAMSLQVGHNYAYIIVYHPDGIHFSRYKLDVYRLDMKSYTFVDGIFTGNILGELLGAITEDTVLEDLFKDNPLFNGTVYASGIIQEKSELNAPDNPWRPYYNFNGWVIGSDTPVCSFPYTILTNMVFYSQYIPIEYEIFYHANGGEINTTKNSYNIESSVVLDIPSRTGYEFGGWYMTEDFSGIPYKIITVNKSDIDSEDFSLSDINLYAKWIPIEYDITYHLNGGINSPENPETYTIETAEIIFNDATRTAYRFDGWFVDEDLSVTITSLPLGSYGDIDIYAKWIPVEYNITYILNGGTLETDVNDYHIEKSVTFDSAERTGYDFVGWYDNANFNGDAITGIALGNYGDKTFYAKWTPTIYTITYVLNGGSFETEINDYHTEKSVTLDQPTREYYDFVGWYDNDNFDGDAVTGVEVGNHGNKTFYAKWTPTIYTITYEMNGGTLETEITDYHIEKSVTFDDPERAGCVFVSWYDNPEFNGDTVTGIEMGNFGDKTFYAKWEPIIYTITYEPNGGSFETEINDYHTEKSVTLDQPEKDYYDFVGWYDNADFNSNAITIIEIGNYGDKTFYAKWTPTIYTITYELNGGTAMGELRSSFTVEDLPLELNLSTPYKENCFFDGWYNDAGFNNPLAQFTEVGDKTVYVKWLKAEDFFTYSLSSDSKYYTVTGYTGSFEEIAIPTIYNNKPVTNIGDSAFENCSHITSVIIPDSVTSIGDTAFENCSGLTSVTIGDSVTSIGTYAFYGCSSLKYNEYSNALYLGNSVNPYVVLVKAKSTNITECTIHNDTKVIYSSAFYNCSSLTRVTIPVSVTSIGSSAFYNCSSLTSVIIPDSVTSIGSSAFYGCSSLTSVIIPDSVTSIGSSAFYNCSGLTSVTIGDSVTSIGNYAFSGCSKLTSITIPDSVTSIGYSAFYGCSSLKYNEYSNALYLGNSVNPYVVLVKAKSTNITECTIHNDTKVIYSSAFEDCSSLTSITIPDSITSIYSSAFRNCSGLTNIYISDIASWCGITGLSNLMYYSSSNKHLYLSGEEVTELVIPDSITSIGSSAFRNCSGLTSITIPDSVTSIGSYAFDGCSGLTSITIPDSITSIGSSAFFGCNSLESITLPFVGGSRKKSNDTYQYPFGYIFGTSSYTGGTATNQYYFGSSTGSTTSTTYYIPTTLKEVTITGGNILYGAFYGCSGLTSITIPDSVRSISSYAFYGCSGLTSVTIPDSVTSIGSYAFYGCSGLTSVTIPDSVTSIGSYAFRNCDKLVEVINNSSLNIEKGSTSNGYVAYYAKDVYKGNYTSKLSTTDDGYIIYTDGNAKILIGYVGFETELIIPDNITEIYKYALSDCNCLTSITIGDSVTSIGDYAFYNCSKLTSITIPDSVTSIGFVAFSRCSSLKTVYYKGSATDWSKISIGSSNTALTNATRVYNVEVQTYNFNSNGGTDIESIVAILVTELPAPEKEGFYFCGWYDNESLSGKPVSFPFYKNGGATLYAKWLTQEEYEEIVAGSSFERAKKAQIGQTYTVNITTSGQLYYFAFTATESGSITVYSSGSLDTYGYFYNSSKSQLKSDDDSGSGSNFSITYTVTAGETYYIVAKLYDSSEIGSFTVTFN